MSSVPVSSGPVRSGPESSDQRRGSRAQPLSRRTTADIVVLLLLAGLGVLGFEPSFGGFSFLLAGIGGLVLGAVTGILASIFRLNVVSLLLVAVIGYFVFGTGIAVPQLAISGVIPTVDSLQSLAVGAVFGWSDILTLRTPIGAPQYIAVVPYVASWIVALLSTSLATRWLSSQPRAAWRFAVTLIAPVILYLSGILLGTDVAYQAGIRGAVFAALALVWIGWRRPTLKAVISDGSRSLRNRKLAGTAIVVAGAVLLGSGAGFWFAPPKDERFVLRDEIKPPFDPLDYPSPLAGFRHYTKEVADDTLFTVSGLSTGDVIRLATLDSYTGKLWNVTGQDSSADGSGSFALVGRSLPLTSFITPSARKNVEFTIDDYKDYWLPSVGYPTSLDFTAGPAKRAADSLRYNDSTGTAVLTTGLVKGDSYTMNAEVQKVLSLESLSKVTTATVDLPPVIDSPDIVTAKAQQFEGKASTPVAQLEAIRLALFQKGYLSHGLASDQVPSTAGHGVDRMTALLTRPQMIGDQEQYASAFALMARSLGYPARVVMGFAPKIAQGQKTVKVTGSDVTAWVEVAFTGVGWVSFNPTPKASDIPQAQIPKPQSIPQPQVRQPPRSNKLSDDVLTPVELQKQKKDEKAAAFVMPAWVYVTAISVLVPLALLFLPMLIVAAVKRRRRRLRRNARAGDDQVAGAWDELIDQFSELGFDVPKNTTRIHLASALESQVAGADSVTLSSIAIRADHAVFSGEGINREVSDAVWTESMAAVALVTATVSTVRRLLSRYRVRSARDWASRISHGASK